MFFHYVFFDLMSSQVLEKLFPTRNHKCVKEPYVPPFGLQTMDPAECPCNRVSEKGKFQYQSGSLYGERERYRTFVSHQARSRKLEHKGVPSYFLSLESILI